MNIKTYIIKWLFANMVTKFVTDDSDHLIEVHLKNGDILFTKE
jgi:hypothetical protein